MIKVTFADFKGSERERAFAQDCRDCLEAIINTPEFSSHVASATYSDMLFQDDAGRVFQANNQHLVQTIQTGKEYRTPADGIINLKIHIKKNMGRRTVGAVKFPDPEIYTNSSFFHSWLRDGDFVSGAAHWIHEWLHVAGFLHKRRKVDENDVNYTVGKIAVNIGKSLYENNRGALVDEKVFGEGYIEAILMERQPATELLHDDLELMAFSDQVLQLGFVDLGTDPRPISGKSYPIVSAANSKLADLPVPNSALKSFNLDIRAFYNDHMPDFLGGDKEGLFKISVNTRNPQATNSGENDVTAAVDFKVKDGNYARGFLHKGIFKNVLFKDFINLRFDLYEVDSDAAVYYNKIRSVVDSVPEMRNLDILNGIPYLNLATKLFEGIIKVFGKNADDHMWNEMPTLDINPSIGGAFLRKGMYIIFAGSNSKREEVKYENIQCKDERLEIASNSIRKLPNHMILSIELGTATENTSI
jgi:hypothetical protein